MSFDIHIVRGPESDNPEHRISAPEWIAHLNSDPELQRITGTNPDFIQAKLAATPGSGEDGQVLTWSRGGISASFPQKPLLSKMARIARHFDAIIISDDGDVWDVSEDGHVRVVTQPEAPKPKPAPTSERLPPPAGIIWPYFNYDPETDPRGIIIWLLSCGPDSDFALAERYLSEGLPMPPQEAAAALRTCLSGQPVGVPGPLDLEELCTLAERIEACGFSVRASGVKVQLW